MNIYIIILILILIIIFLILNKKKYGEIYYLPKKIFTFWHSEDLHPIVKIHIDNWKKKLPEWEIILITMKNIHEYIPKSYYSQFKDLIYQHFADHIRLYLLEKYGGVWMDGSILIKNSLFINNMYDNMIKNKNDIGLFEYSIKSSNKHAYLENWFIMAPQNSDIIKIWKNDFDKCYNVGEDKCRKDIIKSGIDIENTIKSNNYLMMHAIMNKLYFQNKIDKNKIKIYEASDSMFYIQDKFNWNHNKVVEFILSDEFDKLDNIYMIKYTKHTKNAFDNEDKINRYRQKISYL
jgi:hypothetical protein